MTFSIEFLNSGRLETLRAFPQKNFHGTLIVTDSFLAWTRRASNHLRGEPSGEISRPGQTSLEKHEIRRLVEILVRTAHWTVYRIDCGARFVGWTVWFFSCRWSCVVSLFIRLPSETIPDNFAFFAGLGCKLYVNFYWPFWRWFHSICCVEDFEAWIESLLHFYMLYFACTIVYQLCRYQSFIAVLRLNFHHFYVLYYLFIWFFRIINY